MSFYGSVYYQLIDTFYKAVLRNKGKNKTTFVDTNQIPDSVETPAVGRKGVFGFDTGNRWINLNVVSEEKPESNELYSIYEIYHGAPDANADNPGYGFNPLLDEQTIQDRTDEEGIIQLDFHDEFETYNNIYDDAGHIAQSERKIYRLPKAEVNDRVSELERLVGTDTDRQLPEMENEEDQNLYGYVEENTKDIQTLESYTGDWSKVVSYWASGNKWAPTIAETIGNLEDMYSSAVDRYNNHKTFAEIIGKLPNLYEKINEGNPISLIAAILKESTRLDNLNGALNEHKSNAEGQFNGIYTMIGEKIDNDSIYDHIKELYNRIDWDDRENTVSYEIDDLIRRATDLENKDIELEGAYKAADLALETAYKEADRVLKEDLSKDIDAVELKADNNTRSINTINNTTIPGINGRLDGLDKRVDDHYDAWKGTEQALKDADIVLQEKIGNVPTDSNVIDIIDDTKEEIKTLIGTVPEASSVMQEINSISADLGENTSEKTAFTLIQENANAIREIQEDIGTVGENSLVDQINTINTQIGTVGDKALSVQINDINTNLQNYAKSSELEAHVNLANTTYATKSELNNCVTNTQLDEKGYALNSDLETVDRQVNSIIEQMNVLGSPTDFENQISEGSTLLSTIFQQLQNIQVDIKNIKTKINSLHVDGDTPFPEVVEGENTVE